MAITDLLDKDKYVDTQTRRIRINRCESCPEYFSPTKQCKICYCFIRAKTHLKTEQCPDGRW